MKRFGLLLLVAAPMALPAPAMADIVYRELFTHTSTTGAGTDTQTSAAVLGWHMYGFGSGLNAKDQTTSRLYIGKPQSGYPQVGLSSINNAVINGADSNQMYGRAGIQADVASSTITDNLFWTDEYSSFVTAPISTVNNVSWYGSPGSSSNTANLQVRLAIRDSANNWFVSANTFDNSNPGCVPFSGDNSVVLITNGGAPAIFYNSGPLSSMTWNTLTWDAGFARTIGGAATPVGDLTAIGIYNVGNTDNRMDTFTVTATPIPEPGTLGLLFAGAMGLVAFKKRK